MDTAYTPAGTQDAPPQNFPEDAFSQEISAPDDLDTAESAPDASPDIHDNAHAMDTDDDDNGDYDNHTDSSGPDDESDDGFGGPDTPDDFSGSSAIRQSPPESPPPAPVPQNLHQQFARSASAAASRAAHLNLQRAVASGAPPSVTNALRRTADTAEFIAAFPEAAKNPLAIPKEVWDGVRNGLSLTASYSRFAVSQAQSRAQNAQRLAALQANAAALHQQNTSRSTGSMLSAGADYSVNDPFLQGWGE